MSIFDDIYAHNHWGFGSGHGSLPNVTKGYRAYVEQFIRNNGVQRVFEYGCGDWQFSHLIDWGSAEYTGVDIVPAVIEANTKRYGSEKVRFSVNTLTDTNLPHADLLITKDVLQHLATDDIKRFIQHIMPKYR